MIKELKEQLSVKSEPTVAEPSMSILIRETQSMVEHVSG